MKPTPQQYVCDLAPYSPGLPIDVVARKHNLDPAQVIKLASNENPLGMSPKAQEAVRAALADAHRYPDQYALLQALAHKHDIAPSQIVLGNGSNDVLDVIARTFLNDGDEAVSSQYAFAIYQIATQSVGAANVIVSAKEYGHDLDAMLAAVTAKTKVIWIANPNNPTGTLIPYADLRQFLAQVPRTVVVVLDEAYYEYLADDERENAVAWLADYPNLIITRTFSKAYGLAGLRIGYGIASTEVAELLNRIRQPFNVNNFALAAAAASVDDDQFVAYIRQINSDGRKQLIDELTGLGLRCMPAYGNFVTVRLDHATQICEKLMAEGVIVRPLAGYGLADWLRVSVGTEHENQRFVDALKKLLV